MKALFFCRTKIKWKGNFCDRLEATRGQANDKMEWIFRNFNKKENNTQTGLSDKFFINF
jgi:hypothetical protein